MEEKRNCENIPEVFPLVKSRYINYEGIFNLFLKFFRVEMNTELRREI